MSVLQRILVTELQGRIICLSAKFFLLMYDIDCDFLPIVSEGDSIMTQFIIGRVYFCCCGALFCFPLSASVNLLVFLIYLHFNSVKKPVN
jgi:hypothetical protein